MPRGSNAIPVKLSRSALNPSVLYRLVRRLLRIGGEASSWTDAEHDDHAPVGREGTVFGHGPGVHPEDQTAWEWLEEDAPEELRQWADRIRDQFPRLPPDSILYDLDAGLGIDEFESVRDERFQARVRDLHRSIVEAFRRATTPDEWIYAIDEPEAGYYYCYRFWPHRATDATKWYVSPVPDGDDEFFVSQDFSWGALALFGGFPHGEWQFCVFGQRLIDAFAADQPQAFSRTLHGAALTQGDPEQRALETQTAILMFKFGLNCQLARDHGLWNKGLQSRYKDLQRLPHNPGSDTQAQEVLAELIARVELALADAGLEYEPAMSHFND